MEIITAGLSMKKNQNQLTLTGVIFVKLNSIHHQNS